MKYIVLLFVLLIPSLAMSAEDPLLDNPQWSLEFKGGLFKPSLANWKTYYGSDSMPVFGASLGYKLARMVELGVEGEMARDSGSAVAPQHGFLSGSVKYTTYPVNVFLLFRGVFDENQWLVPYAGGGFTRMYYNQKVEGQSSVNGKVDGYHGRAGLQLLLDNLDRESANDLYKDYGIFHTYFFVEAEYTHAVVKSISTDLGGTLFQAGLLFEY